MTIPIRPQPGIFAEADNSKAVSNSAPIPKRLLILGALLPSGTATAAIPIRVLSGDEAVRKFGYGSILSRMVRAAFKAAPNIEIWGLPLSEIGNAATIAVMLTGTANPSDVLQFEIGGQRVAVVLPQGDMSSNLVTNAVLLAFNGGGNAATADFPFSVTSNIANPANKSLTINLTAKNLGVNGALSFRLAPDSEKPSGIEVAFADVSAGTALVDFTNLPSIMTERWFPTIASPWTDALSMTGLETELIRRAGALIELRSQAFVAVSGTSAQLDSWASTRNCPYVTAFAAGYNLRSPAFELAAIAAAVDCNEDIPNLPRQSLSLTGFVPPIAQDRYSSTERNIILGQGLATYRIDPSDLPIIERLVTNYTQNKDGSPDPSYQDTETMRTLTYLISSWRTRMRLRYPRHRLVDNGTLTTASNIVTPTMIANETIALFGEWERDGYVEDFKIFKDNLLITRDLNDRNRINAKLTPNIANMLLSMAASFEFRL